MGSLVRRLRAGAAVVVGGALVAGVTASCGFADPSPFATVQNFLIAWQVENFKAAARSTTGVPQATVISELSAVRQQLDAASLRLSLSGSKIVQAGDGYDAHFTVRIDLGENGDPWIYPTQMHLKRIAGTWRVVWNPSIIHQDLAEGQRLAVVTTPQNRQPILDSKGVSLLKSVRTTLVGVVPGQLQDVQGSMTELAKYTGLDATRLIGRVQSAPPDQFLTLVMLQPSDRRAVVNKILAVPGITRQEQMLPISPSLAPELVGSLGTATSQRLQQVGAPYRPGDTIGVSGLQLLFQRRLAGTPEVQIVSQPAAGSTLTPLATWIPKDTPQAVQTTLDSTVQKRAEDALASLPYAASLVAVYPSGGNIEAVANHRTGGQDRALEGQYAPGMGFGIISAEALLRRGLNPDQKLSCTDTGASVNSTGGRQATFTANFARGCSSMLTSLAGQLDSQSLLAEASRFGIGRDLGLAPVQAYAGSATLAANDTERGQEMAGQTKVTASPLSMALVAAAVSTGTWRAPTLLRNVAADPSSGAVTKPANQDLDGTTIQALQNLLCTSVSAPKGVAHAAKPPGGATVCGISDTVTDASGKTVSWFVGYKAGGDAFALVVEGKVDAAKIAAKFLRG